MEVRQINRSSSATRQPKVYTGANRRPTRARARRANSEYCEDPCGGCCHRVDPFEYRLRALISICRLVVSDHRKKTAPSEQ